MQRLFIHHPIFRLLGPALYGTVVYVLVLLFFDSLEQLTRHFFSQEVLLCVGLAYVLNESLRLSVVGLNRLYPAGRNPRVRVVLQGVVHLLLTVAVISAGVAAYFKWVVGYTTFRAELVTLNALFGLGCGFYNMVYWGLYYLHQHSQHRIAEETLLRQKTEFQLEALKKEANPRLLYSALETLICLVHQDAAAAETFIEKLSAVYRYQLTQKGRELVPLPDELEAAAALVAVYNYQYGGHVKLCRATGSAASHVQVLPGTLTRLVDCAVQNAIITPDRPLHLHLSLERDAALLSFQLFQRLNPPAGLPELVGQLAQAYGFFTGPPPTYTHDKGHVTIRLPLIRLDSAGHEPKSAVPEAWAESVGQGAEG